LILQLKKNSEVRIQESAILTLVPLYETLPERYRYAISRDSDRRRNCCTTKFSFGGGAKTPVIQTLVALKRLSLGEDSLTLRYPPVVQKTLLNSDD
jgi:hypothetical protein